MRRYDRVTENFEIDKVHVHEPSDEHVGTIELTSAEFKDDDIVMQHLLKFGFVKAKRSEIEFERLDDSIMIKDAETGETAFVVKVKFKV